MIKYELKSLCDKPFQEEFVFGGYSEFPIHTIKRIIESTLNVKVFLHHVVSPGCVIKLYIPQLEFGADLLEGIGHKSPENVDRYIENIKANPDIRIKYLYIGNGEKAHEYMPEIIKYCWIIYNQKINNGEIKRGI